jgi:hypothetical protein
MLSAHELTWKPKVKDQRGPEWKLRKCKCCKLTYTPMDKNPANAKRSKFCCRKCKNGYHRYGGMNMDRLHEVLCRRIVKALLADDAFLEALSDKLRVVSGRDHPTDQGRDPLPLVSCAADSPRQYPPG